MKLILDTREYDCVAWKVDAPEGGRVIWRFVTQNKQVWRVCLDSRIPAARTMVNTDATEVRVVSLLWPMHELCEIVHAANTDRQKRVVVRGFLANLLRQFDWRFVGTIQALAKVPNGRRDLIGAIPRTCDLVQLEVPERMVKEVCSKVTMLGANPTHTACATFLREFERELEKTDLMDDYDAGWLSLIVKRLALKYDIITPEPRHRNASARFGNMHASSLRSALFDECRRHAVSDERMDAKSADGCAFQSFLRNTEFVAIHNWPDFTLALPVLWVDTVPQEMDAADADLFDRTPTRKTTQTKGGSVKRGPKPPSPDEKQKEDRILTRWDAALARDTKLTYDEFGRDSTPPMSGTRLEALIGRVRKRRKKAAGKARQ